LLPAVPIASANRAPAPIYEGYSSTDFTDSHRFKTNHHPEAQRRTCENEDLDHLFNSGLRSPRRPYREDRRPNSHAIRKDDNGDERHLRKPLHLKILVLTPEVKTNVVVARFIKTDINTGHPPACPRNAAWGTSSPNNLMPLRQAQTARKASTAPCEPSPHPSRSTAILPQFSTQISTPLLSQITPMAAHPKVRHSNFEFRI
jgi:hypothetical protein